MLSTGQKKLDQMRAYAKTPAAREKRRIRNALKNKPMEIKPQALAQALANWR